MIAPLREAHLALQLLWSRSFLWIAGGLFALIFVVPALTLSRMTVAMGFAVLLHFLSASMVLSGVPRLVWLLREARQLQLPHAQARLLRGSLILLVVLMGLLFLSHASMSAPPILGWLAVQLCIMALLALFVVLPFNIVFVIFALLPMLMGRLRRANPPPASLVPSMIAHLKSMPVLLIVAATLGAVAVFYGRRIIRNQRPNAGWSTSLTEKLGVNRAGAVNIPKDANALTRQTPVWMLPGVRADAARRPMVRLLTLLGPPFAPGYRMRNLALVAVIWAITLITSPNRNGASLATVTAMGVILVAVLQSYAMRIRLLWRRECGELAELALLPNATPRTSEAAALGITMLWAVAAVTVSIVATFALLAIVTRPLRALFWAQNVALGAATTMGIATSPTTWLQLLPALGLVAAIQVALLLGLLARGRPFIASMGWSIFTTIAGQAGLILLITSAARVLPSFSAGVQLAAMLAGALLLLVVLVLGMRWFRQLRALPHPWLPASERSQRNIVGG